MGGGLSSRCPLANPCYAYRRFSAARQARSALFRQARRPAYETLFGSKDLTVSFTIAPNRNILPPPQIPEHRHVALRHADILLVISNSAPKAFPKIEQPVPSEKSIAVLPFENLSVEKENSFF